MNLYILQVSCIGLLFFIFFLDLFTKAYKIPRYHDFYRYSGETFLSYWTRRFSMFLTNVKKRLHYLSNFFRFSALLPFFYEQVIRFFKDLFLYYKKFNKLEENKTFIELLPTLLIKLSRWFLWSLLVIFILTYLFLLHLWVLREKIHFYYNPGQGYVVFNIYLLLLFCFISYPFIGKFIINKTIVYETPIRFIDKGEPTNLYKPDWNNFTLLKLEDPQHPGRLLTPEQIEMLTFKYKSLDVLIDNQLIETYGQYFIKGYYDQDLRNLIYNPQTFGETLFFFEKNKTSKYWHELNLQFLDRKQLNKRDERIPHWIREPLEHNYPGIESIFGLFLFQLFQLGMQLTMNYYNIWPGYEDTIWALSWGWDSVDDYFYAPWLKGHTFKDYLNNLNIS